MGVLLNDWPSWMLQHTIRRFTRAAATPDESALRIYDLTIVQGGNHRT